MIPCRETIINAARPSTQSVHPQALSLRTTPALSGRSFSSTSTAYSILPNTQPSPIAEFPAREAAALQEDVNAIPAPAIAAKTPLSQEVKLVRHFQALQDINTEIFRLGYRGMRLFSGDLQCRRDQPRRGRIARIKTVSKPKSALLYSIQVEQPGPVPQELSQGAQADCRRVLLRPGGRKGLSKMSPEHKNLEQQQDTLNRLQNEIRSLDGDILAEETSSSDFKRTQTQTMMGLKFGGLLECCEKGTENMVNSSSQYVQL
ncbi:hypothetical protein M378DRAFT_11148 [Amanita muscaria Koide BX008]|uniref:Uncharacterized protein n=1 Tax=Amanita muscaria (strain Koide BX008) TaxID=946122 RepID=A0A0C2X8J0_AMAMK|nr:hypothetical protein M378DRAFT_11148 [Amanita muscaria Koide BX008]